MGIELQEAKKKMSLLKSVKKNPELIFTDLFSHGVHGGNFLLQINIDGVYILDYLTECIKSLSLFKGTLLKFRSFELSVSIPTLKYKDSIEIPSTDKVIEINLDKKTYCLCNTSIDSYRKIMDEVLKLEQYELSDFWKQYQNLTFKKRIKNVLNVLKSTRKVSVKIADIIHHLTISKKEIEVLLEKAIHDVNMKNLNAQHSFIEKGKRRAYYQEHAPKQISKIKTKQKEIAKYLSKLGYQEEE